MGTGHGTRRRAATILLAGAVVGAALAGPTAAIAGSGYGPMWKFVKGKLSKQGTINAPKNPVDFTRLKNVPAGFADGVDDTGGGIGAITERVDNDQVDGGTAHNGKYVLDYVEVFCEPGETAISGNGYFGGTLNPNGPGGDDDLEVMIASVHRTDDGAGNEGYRVWGGNDSGVTRNLIVQVLCLAP
ncbi:MAG: hypothetical protein ACXWYC_10915 [Actinomycetota bacterium]